MVAAGTSLTRRIEDCEPGEIAISAISFAEVALGSHIGKPPPTEVLDAFLEAIPLLPFDEAGRAGICTLAIQARPFRSIAGRACTQHRRHGHHQQRSRFRRCAGASYRKLDAVMSDTAFLLMASTFSCVAAMLLTLLLATRRATWRRRKIILLAALPIPGVIALLCLWVFGKALVTALFVPQSCGVDACGMAMMFSSIGLVWTFIVYAVSIVAALLAYAVRQP